ncbi:MAG: 30S ribosome-binding factor RbfA [Pseudomonadota bacterium]
MAQRNPSKAPSQRQLRVGENVRHAVIEVLQRGDVSDPVLEKAVVSISEVRMSPDLKIATCFVSPLGPQDAKAVSKALAANAKAIRHAVTPALRGMKYMPSFRFLPDESFDNYSRIDDLLRSPEVKRDVASTGDDSDRALTDEND